MKKYKVTIYNFTSEHEVEADSQEQAELEALKLLDEDLERNGHDIEVEEIIDEE